jgi:alpha-D-ribose 1-methylphosphonate 5-triphosphate synthase subunit PhnH
MSAAVQPGFGSPVHDAQAAFRSVMMAMARPGTVRRIEAVPGTPDALEPAAAAIALALCDFETPVWLDPALAADDAVTSFLAFHTGAPVTATLEAAHFAFLPRGAELPDFTSFAQGDLSYPDRGATLVIAVQDFDETAGWSIAGPGIAGAARFRAWPLPADMPHRLAANHALFPRGVDLLFVAGNRLAALPRSTMVEA